MLMRSYVHLWEDLIDSADRVDSESGIDTRNRETMVDHRRASSPYKEHNVAGHYRVFIDSIREMRGTLEIITSI